MKFKGNLRRDRKAIEKNIKYDFGKTIDYIKEPKHIKILKITVIFVALGIIGFLIYNNLLVSKEFNYFYDIGGEKDTKNPYLTPSERISEIFVEDEIDYRKLKNNLLYMNPRVIRGSEKVILTIRFQNNFPLNSKFSIGAKKDINWIYNFKEIYYNGLNLSGEGKWLDEKIEFNLKKDIFYVENNKLSLVLNAPHLEKEQYANYTIPIDWINITVYKPGMIERIKGGETFLEALKEVMS